MLFPARSKASSSRLTLRKLLQNQRQVPCQTKGGLFRDIPTPELNKHGTVGNALCNLGGRVPEDLDFIICEVVLI